MPDLHTDIEAKIAVLEVQVDHLRQDAQARTAWLSSIDSKVDDIKSRLDKQNGTLPHLAEDVRSMSESISKMHEALTAVQTSAQESKIKMAALWGGIGAVLLTLLAVVAKFMLKI